MNRGVVLIEADGFLIFTKDTKSYKNDFIMFFLFAVVLYLGISLILYFSSILESWQQFILPRFIFLFLYYLINIKNLQFNLFKIQKVREKEFKLNDEICFTIDEGISLLKYEYAGELFLNKSGNLFLKVREKEFRLCNGISDADFDFIIEKLKPFFSMPSLKIECKRIL